MIDHSTSPTMEPVVEIATIVGTLLAPRDDRIITPVLLRDGAWEVRETHYLLAILREGQTFVDVGAHVGYFSVLASARVGPAGTVIAVEPEARNLDLLHRNLARNGCRMARVIPFAAGAQSGAMSLALDEHNRGGHRLVAADSAEGAYGVRCVRLDDMLPATVDVIKIDAQGYDHEVLEGLERTLVANPDAIVLTEISRDELARRGVRPEAVLARYEELDFTLAVLLWDGTLCRVSAADVLALMADPDHPSDFTLVLRRPVTPPFTAESRPAWVQGLELEEDPEGLTVSDPAAGRIHRLNWTAAAVFDLCTGEHSVTAIAQLVQGAFELAEPPTAAVEECLEQLRRERLLRRA